MAKENFNCLEKTKIRERPAQSTYAKIFEN